jgi:hypothetical protein
LPAHSRNAAGVNVLKYQAWQRYRCYAIASNQVLDFGLVGSIGQRVQRSLGRDRHFPAPTRGTSR